MTVALDDRSRDLVFATWTALETATLPVSSRDYPALADPSLRGHLERLARQAGRTLIEHANGWLTGYDNAIAARLAADGIGVLPTDDRAVLALVLINTVCLHRSQGSPAPGWEAPGVATETLFEYRPQYRSVVRASLRRLEAAGLVERSPSGGVAPGSALSRLTPEQSRRLWEDLIVAADPHSPLANAIRARREQEVP